MTDKQIIIDGIDIGGCEFYTNNGWCCYALVYEDYCKDCPDCMYKLKRQLEAKEQECEELKDKLSFHIDSTNKQNEVLHNKNQELKAENVKFTLDTKKLVAQYSAKLDLLKQTLTEIKEIAEKKVSYFPDGEIFARPEIEQILKICDEVNQCENQ